MKADEYVTEEVPPPVNLLLYPPLRVNMMGGDDVRKIFFGRNLDKKLRLHVPKRTVLTSVNARIRKCELGIWKKMPGLGMGTQAKTH